MLWKYSWTYTSLQILEQFCRLSAGCVDKIWSASPPQISPSIIYKIWVFIYPENSYSIYIIKTFEVAPLIHSPSHACIGPSSLKRKQKFKTPKKGNKWLFIEILDPLTNRYLNKKWIRRREKFINNYLLKKVYCEE